MIAKLKFSAEMKVSIVKAYQSGCLCHELDGPWLGFDFTGCGALLATDYWVLPLSDSMYTIAPVSQHIFIAYLIKQITFN